MRVLHPGNRKVLRALRWCGDGAAGAPAAKQPSNGVWVDTVDESLSNGNGSCCTTEALKQAWPVIPNSSCLRPAGHPGWAHFRPNLSRHLRVFSASKGITRISNSSETVEAPPKLPNGGSADILAKKRAKVPHSVRREVAAMALKMWQCYEREEYAQVLHDFDINLAAKARIPKSTTCFDFALLSAAKLRDANTARHIYAVMLEHDQAIGYVANGSVIMAVRAAEGPKAAFDFLTSQASVRTPRTFSMVLSEATRQGDTETYARCLEAMRADGIASQENAFTWRAALMREGESGNLEGVLKVWDECRSSPTFADRRARVSLHASLAEAHISLLRPMDAAQAFLVALDTFRELEGTPDDAGSDADGKSPAAALNPDRSFGKPARHTNSRAYKPDSWLNATGYRVLLLLIKAGLLDKAGEVAISLMQSRIQITQAVYHTLLRLAYTQGRDASVLLDIIAEMRRHSVQASGKSYGWIFKTYLRSGNLQAAKKLIDKMQAEGIPSNDFCTTVVLHLLVADWDAAYAMKLYSQLVADGIQPHGSVYVRLFQGVSHLRHPNESSSSMGRRPLPPEERHRRHLMLGEAKEALDVWAADAETAGLFPKGGRLSSHSAALVTTYIKALSQTDQPHKILSLLKGLELRREDAAIFESAVRALAKLGELQATLEADEMLRASGNSRTDSTYAALIHAAALSRDHGFAKRLAEQMAAEGITTTLIVLRSLLKANFTAMKVDEALALIEESQEAGLELDKQTWLLVAREGGMQRQDIVNAAALKAAGNPEKFSQLLAQQGSQMPAPGAFDDDSDDDLFGF